MTKVALVKCPDYTVSTVEKAVRETVRLLGGIERFVKPDSRVLIKPNLLIDKEPEYGITTHPEVVRAVIRILKEINAKIYVGDGPSAWHERLEKIELVWEKTGLQQVAEEEKVELVKFNKNRWRNGFTLTTWLDEVDYLISIPKFKTHDLTVLTGAVKNLFGLIQGRYKIHLHKKYFSPQKFSRKLVDLYEIIQPALTIVDGVLVLEGEGPGRRGERRTLGMVAAGVDCVSIDSVLAVIMGVNPGDIPTNQEAAERNIGKVRIEDIQILGDPINTFKDKPFKLPITTFKYKIPLPFVEIINSLIRFYPVVNPKLCTRCGACIGICPQKIICQKNGKIKINYSACISCFCCNEVCPCAAISIKKSWFAKLMKI